jgi:hypothetical protein
LYNGKGTVEFACPTVEDGGEYVMLAQDSQSKQTTWLGQVDFAGVEEKNEGLR